MFRQLLYALGLSVMISGCAKMNQIQPNSELLPGYSMKGHSDRVTLQRTNRVRSILAAEWVAEDVLALVAQNAENDEGLTRDSVSIEFYSIDTGRRANLSAERTQLLTNRVFEAQEFERRKVPEDEKKIDFYVASENHFAGADYLSKGVFYSRKKNFERNKDREIRWKGASYGGQDIRLLNYQMFDWAEFGFDFVQVEAAHQWSLDVHPTARYFRVRDVIFDLETEKWYELQNGFLATNYAFSPTWDRLLLVYRPGMTAPLTVDMVEFDVTRLENATPATSE